MSDIYSNIITRAGRKVQKTDTAYKTKLKDWAGEWYEKIYNRYFWNDLFREIEISVSSGVNHVILPRQVNHILYVTDLSNDILVRKYGVQNFQKRFLDRMDQQGTVYHYAQYGYSPVATQLSTADAVEVLSSSASDTTQTVYIRGYDSNGLEQAISFALNGTTAVSTNSPTFAAFSIANPRSGLSMVSKDADTVGNITIREKTADTVLGYLSPLERTARHRIIRVVDNTSSSESFFIGFKEPLRKLVNDGDVTQFECEDLLVRGIYIESLKEQRQFQRAAIEEQGWEKDLTARLQAEERDQEQEDGAIPEINSNALPIDTPHTP